MASGNPEPRALLAAVLCLILAIKLGRADGRVSAAGRAGPWQIAGSGAAAVAAKPGF